ncbi:MAG: methionine gamma-lyase family protein [Firmicutes bacterium]|nr:methionine gamma-lyase family protein [Bacillota bacterium]
MTSVGANASILSQVQPLWQQMEETVAAPNTQKVLDAFRHSRLSGQELLGTTGYGYDDRGRERLDNIVAEIFHTEAALVRAQWASGTHTLMSMLNGCVRSGQTLWIASGPVYDTLQPILFDTAHPLSLSARGVKVRQLPLDEQYQPIWPMDGTRPDVVYIQRSLGYEPRPAWGPAQMKPVIAEAHARGAIVLVDNCHGEFTTTEEPTQWGADLVAGGLMKNPGGGIAPTGGYVAGRKDLVQLVADALFAPHIGSEVGATAGYQRLLAQGWFMAPRAVAETLAGGFYAQYLFHQAGFDVFPLLDDFSRYDTITAIRLASAQRITAFCQAIQQASPIDAQALPEAQALPGYTDPIIMAAGGFVTGATAELSADAPMRDPYWVYLQGGLNRWHTIIAADHAFTAVSAHPAPV